MMSGPHSWCNWSSLHACSKGEDLYDWHGVLNRSIDHWSYAVWKGRLSSFSSLSKRTRGSWLKILITKKTPCIITSPSDFFMEQTAASLPYCLHESGRGCVCVCVYIRSQSQLSFLRSLQPCFIVNWDLLVTLGWLDSGPRYQPFPISPVLGCNCLSWHLPFHEGTV